MTKPVVAVTIGTDHYDRMFSEAAWDTLASFADIVHATERPASKAELTALLAAADGCITSWGVHKLDDEVVAAAPR
ncbi:MAG: hypothetical protein P8N50_12765, partial [Actinomycetota bacterium]|nr:hypothetical protein [Actinomycetota bacterium]